VGDDGGRPDGSGFPHGLDGSTTDDVVEQDSRRFPAVNWRPSRSACAAILGTAGLLAGLAVGYAAGERQARNTAKPPQLPAASASPAAPAAAVAILAQSNGGCSAQVGHELQLGEQVTNQSGATVALRKVEAVLPLGGLRAVSEQWEPCGFLPTGQEQPGSRLAPGASIWFTVTFQVLRRCPRPLPVQFTIDYAWFTIGYDWHAQPAAASLPGFPDLGKVPYSGCPAH
jgi:hypothetical protein